MRECVCVCVCVSIYIYIYIYMNNLASKSYLTGSLELSVFPATLFSNLLYVMELDAAGFIFRSRLAGSCGSVHQDPDIHITAINLSPGLCPDVVQVY